MKMKVLKFFVFLLFIVLVLGIVQIIDFKGFTTKAIIIDEGLEVEEWQTGMDANILDYSFSKNNFKVSYHLKSFDNEDRTVNVEAVLLSEGKVFSMTEERVILGAGDEQEYVINFEVDKLPFESVLKMNFDDGTLVRERNKDILGAPKGISSFAVRENSEENKFNLFGIIFIVLIFSIFVFEFLYKKFRRADRKIEHKFGRKFGRKLINLDVS